MKFSKATVDKAQLYSPPNRKINSSDEVSSSIRISEILGEPVILSPQFDSVTDELAEVISNGAFNLAKIDDGEPTLVSLKPIMSTSLVT